MADSNSNRNVRIPTIELQTDVENDKSSEQQLDEPVRNSLSMEVQSNHLLTNSEYNRHGSSTSDGGYSSCHSRLDSSELRNISGQEDSVTKFFSCQEDSFQHDNPELQGYLLAFDEWVKIRRPHVGNTSYMSQTRTFAATFIDNSGGYLTLPKYNTSLFVPPGAVAKIQKIYIFVEVKSPSLPCPVKDARWQPNILHCGPPGIHFESDVVLSFPCGTSNLRQFRFGACWSSSDEDDWQDLNSPKDAIVTSSEGLVNVMIDHFSKFSSYSFMHTAQSLNAGVFIRRVPTETQTVVVQLHVILWNEGKENQVMKDEALLGARLCDRVRTFRVEYQGGDVVIHLGIQSSTPTIDSGVIKNTQVISIHDILEELNSPSSARSPSVTFAAQADQNPPDPFISTVFVTQKQGSSNDVEKVKFLVLPPSCDGIGNYDTDSVFEEKSEVKRALYATNRNSTPNTSFRNSQSDLSPPSGAFTSAILSPEEFTHLAELISREDPRGLGDWRVFADTCGLRPYYQVEERAAHQRKSPGTLVLTHFLAVWGARLGRDDTLRKLLGVLESCQISQAVTLVRQWLRVESSLEEAASNISQAKNDHDQCADMPVPVTDITHTIGQDGLACCMCRTNSDTQDSNVNMVNVIPNTSQRQRDSIYSEDVGLGASIDRRSISTRSNSVVGKTSWSLIQSLSLG